MPRKMREMVGGCCVCSDERGWDENPLVYCDGQGCNVAVHQACYGIVTVPTGPWFCRKCESQERSARVRCELCPNKDGALKRTDSNSWAHVVCALYIPEVRFGNVATMEPIVLGLVPSDRYLKVCYLCEQQGRESRASTGACMQCNRAGCKQTFHVTCAQSAGLLCEEAGNYMDNVKYCGYCDYHYQRINKKVVKTIPAFRPQPSSTAAPSSDEEEGSASPSKSPKESPGAAGSNSVPSQGRNSSMSTSSSSSKKGKKGRRTNQGMPSSTTGSPKSDTEKAAANFPASPTSTSSIILKRSQSEDDPKKDEHASTSKSSADKETSKISTTTGSGTSNNTSAVEKNNDVSSSSAEIAEKKPPSVIVKFGKQDGTYYSKKQDTVPSANKKEKEKEKDKEKDKKEEKDKEKKHNESGSSNSSVTISTNAIGNRDAKDLGSSASGTSNSSSTAQSVKETNDKKYLHQDAAAAAAKQQKGFTRANFTESTVAPSSSVSASMFSTTENKKEDNNKVEPNDKLTIVKVEPMDISSPEVPSYNHKKPPGPVTAPEPTRSTNSTHVTIKAPTTTTTSGNSVSKTTSTSSVTLTSSTSSVNLEKSKHDLKVSDGKGQGSNSGHGETRPSSERHYGFGMPHGGGKVGLDRQSVHPYPEKPNVVPSSIKDSPAKIIPILPPVSLTATSNSNYIKSAKLDLKTTTTAPPSNPPVTVSAVSTAVAGVKRPAEIMSAPPPTNKEPSSQRTPVDDKRSASPPRINTELISPGSDSKSSMGPKRTASGKGLGRPPKKGTHLQSDSLGPMASGSAEGNDGRSSSHESPERGSSSGDVKRRKQSPASRLTNGSDSVWMMGATLNPSSNVAKEMDACLKDEIQTHSAYDPTLRTQYHGVPFPGSKKNSHKSSSSTSSQVSSEPPASAKGPQNQQPQTLEELLERQWEQGSQFLMEQASHFDIASLLSSLHQLKGENLELEDSVDRLVQRRDHLLAVRARLMALSSLSTTSPQNSTQTTPERPSAAQHTNGPSPASGRSSAHVSPRNSAATVSPIRVERSTTSAATIISPRNLPPPQPTGNSLISPRDRPMSTSATSGSNLPPSHHMHQLASPRDRVPERSSSGGGMPPMENGIDFHPPVSQHPGGASVFISSTSQNMQNRGQIYASSRGGGNLLAVVSSANSGVHPGSSGGQQPNPGMAHHRSMPHHMSGPPSGGHVPSHSPHVQTPPPSSGQGPQPPPRQSAYPNSSMSVHSSGASLPPPPPSHASSRPGVHMGHPGHGLPPPPGSMMRPPMPHPDLRPPPFPGGYHQMSSNPRVGPPHGPPPTHGHPRPTSSMMAMAQHMRSSNVMDKR